jgi:PilZ domain
MHGCSLSLDRQAAYFQFTHASPPDPSPACSHPRRTPIPPPNPTPHTFRDRFSFLAHSLIPLSRPLGVLVAKYPYDTQQRNERMRRERRKYLRVESSSAARIFYGELVRPCIVSNLSNGGARIAGVRAYTFPREFMLRATPHGRIRKCHVLWRTDDALGVRFVDWDTGVATPIAASTVQEPSS